MIRTTPAVILLSLAVGVACGGARAVYMGQATPQAVRDSFRGQIENLQTVCLDKRVELNDSLEGEGPEIARVRDGIHRAMMGTLESNSLAVVDAPCEATFSFTVSGWAIRRPFDRVAGYSRTRATCWYPRWRVEASFRILGEGPGWITRNESPGQVSSCRNTREQMGWNAGLVVGNHAERYWETAVRWALEAMFPVVAEPGSSALEE